MQAYITTGGGLARKRARRTIRVEEREAHGLTCRLVDGTAISRVRGAWVALLVDGLRYGASVPGQKSTHLK